MLAAEWYTSGTFWAASGVIVAAVSAVMGAWVAYRVARPKRRLVYGASKAKPLISAPDDMRPAFAVSLNGRELTDPYVLDVWLRNAGHRDIASDDYDDDRAIQLDIGAEIVAVTGKHYWAQTRHTYPIEYRLGWEFLGSAMRRASLYEGRVVAEGSTLAIGPTWIGRYKKLSFSLLVDGRPELTCYAPLLNVDVRESHFHRGT